MTNSVPWGILSTISSRFSLDPTTQRLISPNSGGDPVPFGNVFSFADAPCGESSSDLYLYMTSMDQSSIDLESHQAVSLAISEANLNCGDDAIAACSVADNDPMNPPCARLIITGTLEILDGESGDIAKTALFSKHPTMGTWPKGHGFYAAKMVIQDLWFIDFYGGASILDVDDFNSNDLISVVSGNDSPLRDETTDSIM